MPARRTVLVVASDVALREILTRRFIRRGLGVIPVSHPRQALAAATARDFQVAVVSRALPGFDAGALVKKLARRVRGLRFVVLSRESEATEEYGTDGAALVECVITPCRAAEVERAVSRALEKGDRRGDVPSEAADQLFTQR